MWPRLVDRSLNFAYLTLQNPAEPPANHRDLPGPILLGRPDRFLLFANLHAEFAKLPRIFLSSSSRGSKPPSQTGRS